MISRHATRYFRCIYASITLRPWIYTWLEQRSTNLCFRPMYQVWVSPIPSYYLKLKQVAGVHHLSSPLALPKGTMLVGRISLSFSGVTTCGVKSSQSLITQSSQLLISLFENLIPFLIFYMYIILGFWGFVKGFFMLCFKNFDLLVPHLEAWNPV